MVAILLTMEALGQDIPLLPSACQGSVERYWVKGFNGTSNFEWRITDPKGKEVPANVITAINSGKDSVAISWNFPGMVGGTYTLHITERTPWGCTGEEYTQDIVVNTSEIFIPITSFTDVKDNLINLCSGSTFELEVQLKDGSRKFVSSQSGWLDLNEPFTPTRIISQAGTFTVKVVDNLSACSYDTVKVIKHDLPKVSLGDDIELCLNNTATITPTVDKGTVYTWYLDGAPTWNSPLSFTVGKAPAEVVLTVADSYGCTGADTLQVKTCSISSLRIPSAFTPNGDGMNDRWVIPDFLDKFQVQNLSIDVYNRWGKRVYSFKPGSYDESKMWDGKDSGGARLPVDSYHYIIRFEYDGQRTVLRGPVTILL